MVEHSTWGSSFWLRRYKNLYESKWDKRTGIQRRLVTNCNLFQVHREVTNVSWTHTEIWKRNVGYSSNNWNWNNENNSCFTVLANNLLFFSTLWYVVDITKWICQPWSLVCIISCPAEVVAVSVVVVILLTTWCTQPINNSSDIKSISRTTQVTFNGMVTCEIKLFENYFSPSKLVLHWQLKKALDGDAATANCTSHRIFVLRHYFSMRSLHELIYSSV